MQIDTDNLKRKLTQYLDLVTQKKGRNTYICPICNSGKNGGKNTPAFTVNGDVWHCFACNQGGDLLNLVAIKNKLDYKTQFKEVVEQASRDLGLYYQSSTNSQKESIFNFDVQAYLDSKRKKMNTEQEERPDYTKFLTACKEAVTQTEYYQTRGLNKETIEAYNLGYLTQDIINQYKDTCKLGNNFKSGDYIIPYNQEGSYFIARHNEENTQSNGHKATKPSKNIAGDEPLFNADALATTDKPIFITEGAFDALSIIQSGGQAIALGGTGCDKLLTPLDEMLKNPEYKPSFIIATDNDTAGQNTAQALANALEVRNVIYSVLEYPTDVIIKDPNEWLCFNKDSLKTTVIALNDKLIEQAQEHEIKLTEEYNLKSASAKLDGIIHNWDNIEYSPIPTGFKVLDRALDGGLYSGLYAVGALSSLGKTTFILQLADQIAQSGTDVLFFSLEMATDELVGRSLSRLSFLISEEKTGEVVLSLTSNNIRNPKKRNFWQQMNNISENIQKAEARYRDYAKNIFIIEGLGDISALDIRKAITEHQRRRGKTPVVIVDYVQIMDVYNERYTDKQNMDKNIVELKRISRDFKLPVIAISSFNRDSYNSAVTLSAFKESGAIEYTSDVVIGLQPQGMLTGSNETEKKNNVELINKTKEETIRKIQLKILKNRNGGLSNIDYKYYTLYNFYDETGLSPKDKKEKEKSLDTVIKTK